MKLSILTPGIPSRVNEFLMPLLAKLQQQVDALPTPGDVELLTFIDNKRRTIGMKRQSLLEIAQGDYIAFIDDDDDVSDDYIQDLWQATTQDVDVITFKQDVYLNGSGPYPLTFKLGHKGNDNPSMSGFTRPPWHVCAWRREIAQQKRFGDMMYGEDWYWVKQVNKLAKTSHHIDRTLCTYRYSDAITQAK